MFFHSVWKPMLAGAVGAAIMTAAVIGSVWVILPKISSREVVIDHVIQKDVPFDNHVPQEKPFDNYVPHNKPFDLPVPMPGPQASAKQPMGPDSPYAPKTPDEHKFTDNPEYKDATYRGRIVKSRDGHELSFEDGKDFHPAHWDDASGKVVQDPTSVIRSDEFVGDLGVCVPEKGHGEMWDCTAMHNGQVVTITSDKSVEATPPVPADGSGPTTAAAEMVGVNVDLAAHWQIRAMVDTGCAWPMALPSGIAEAMLDQGLAIRAGTSPVTLADGSTHDVDVILIKSIMVEGRTLHDVEASVASSQIAPVLLGLGALNRLGSYTITDGRLVFTSEQPA